MTTPEISTPDRLYVRAGGMAFFEGLVDRFYDGVEADPDLRPIYPEPDLAGARHRLTLFLAQYWGGPTTYDQERGHPAAADAPRAVRDRRRRSATAGSSTCAPPSRRWPRRPTSPPTSSATSRWPPRRCATATDRGPPDPGPTGRTTRPGTLCSRAAWPGRGATGRRHWRTARGLTRHIQQRGKTVHGEAANAGHRVLAPDDAEVEAYLETALNAPAPDRSPDDRPDGDAATAPGTVVVLDFGSQFAQLIARRVRELDVYSELLPHDTPYEELERRGARGDHPVRRPEFGLRHGRPPARPGHLDGRIPVLGICYGAQLMAHELGGDVLAADRREYGPANVSITTRRRRCSAASTASSRSG